MKARTKKKAYRIDWSDLDALSCAHLINHGLHASAIGRATGLTEGQVYYRARRLGMRLTNYRNGKGSIAAVLLKRFNVSRKKIYARDSSVLLHEVQPIVQRRLQEYAKKRK